MQVQAAAISLADERFVVVAANLELLRSPGEADMAIEQLQGHFGVAVVLLALNDKGSPNYYGDSDLVELLRGVPTDEMPWKEYDVPA
jgi:hypothetical protein